MSKISKCSECPVAADAKKDGPHFYCVHLGGWTHPDAFSCAGRLIPQAQDAAEKKAAAAKRAAKPAVPDPRKRKRNEDDEVTDELKEVLK
jgi:hypothetical protein